MISYLHYDYHFLFQDHLSLAAFGMLIFCFIACYYFKHYFLRGVFLFLALLLALYAQRISWLGLAEILIFGLVFYKAYHTQSRMWRGCFFSITLFLCCALFFVHPPGIFNWQVLSKVVLTDNAIPYSMWFTFDKSLIGLFFIWFSALSLANEGKWKLTLKKGFVVGILATMALIPLSYFLGYVTLDIKVTNLIFLFVIHNLFFVCIAEEAVFRGMIQKSLMLRLQSYNLGKQVALLLSAVLFGAVHYPGGPKYILLAFVAGLFYGYAFMKTEKIEASVLTHFMVNVIHFVVFTYPALKIQI